jgi:hypothetical protein
VTFGGHVGSVDEGEPFCSGIILDPCPAAILIERLLSWVYPMDAKAYAVAVKEGLSPSAQGL